MALITRDFVFVHVPKTAGTSCRSAIIERYPDAIDSNGTPAIADHPLDATGVPIPPDQHASASSVERRLPDTIGLRFVGFVRHPVTWYGSMWAWAKQTGFGPKIDRDELAKRHWLAAVWSENFPEFMDRVLALQVPRAWVVFHERLTRTSGQMCEIGKFESLSADFHRLTGCPRAPLPRYREAAIQDRQMSGAQESALRVLERETILKWYCL